MIPTLVDKSYQVICLFVLLGLGACQSQSAVSSMVSAKKPASITYQTSQLPSATVHIVTIPPGYQIIPVVAPQLKTIEEFSQITSAKVIINAGFFDPMNAKTTSYIIHNGQIIANPKDNERLTGNPDLQSYLPQILNRSEFRRYQCTSQPENTNINQIQYDIQLRQAGIPQNCQLLDAIGAGPQLLPTYTAVAEAFIDPAKNRDALGTNQANARTAIGIKPDGTVLLVMVAQTPTQKGMTLPQVSEFLKQRNVKTALNLDGGSSSSLYVHGQSFYGKRDRAGNPVKRGVKSVLIVP